MAYNTGNPVGSTDPRDLFDNAQNIDEIANSTTKTAQPDRLGVDRKTLKGMGDEFDTFIDNSENQYNAYMSSLGYEYLGDYGAGINVTSASQIVRYASEYWKAAGSVLPFTTTGTWATDEGKFTPVGDAALRSEIGSGVRRVDSIAALRLLSGRFANDSAAVLGYYAPGDGGGGPIRVWKTNAPGTYVDNGGSIIVPTGGDGSGGWVLEWSGAVNVKWFGAKGDGVSNDTDPFTRAFSSTSLLAVTEGHYKLTTWVVFSGTTDFSIEGSGMPHIEGPGYTGVGSANFIDSTGNVSISGIKFSKFISICSSLPATLNDYFNFTDNETIDTIFAINLSVNDIGGGYRKIVVKGNKITNTTYGAWIVTREMHNTIVVDNVFSDLSNSFGGGSGTQAVMIGLDTFPGTRLNAIVSNNTFQNIINGSTGETTAIMIHDVRRCTVNSNVIDTVTGGAGEGIYIRREDTDATCVGNTIVDCEFYGIAAKGGKTVIANNRISGRNLIPLYGIGQIEALNCLVDSNWISNCYLGISSLSPVSERLQSRVEISNNVIIDSVRCGIYAAGRSRSQIVTGNKIKRVTGGAVIPLSGLGPEDINVGIDTSYTLSSTRCVFTNNHVSEILGSTLGSNDGLDSVAYRLRSTAGTIFAEINSYDTVEYGFWVEQTVCLQNNYLEYASRGVYHPSSTASASSTLQEYRNVGLAFPSNHTAVVTDPNTLDAYAEGLWTPIVGRTSTFGTYTAGVSDGGKYTRIGNVVYFSCRVTGTNTTAIGGNWVIRGLPFTSAVNAFWGRTAVTGYDMTNSTVYITRIIENSTDILIAPTWISGSDSLVSGFYFVS